MAVCRPDLRSKKTSLVKGAAICLSVMVSTTLVAAQGLDTTADSNKPAAVRPHPVGGFEPDDSPNAPASAGPSALAPPSDHGQAGITPPEPKPVPASNAASAVPGASDPSSSPERSAVRSPPLSEPAKPDQPPLKLDHPKVIDTAQLQAGDTIVTLFGIDGLTGDAALGLQTYLGQSDGHLTCQIHDSTSSVCLMSDGTDVALVALVNGAARVRPEAPDVYREQENAAQANRRGIWDKLPPAPETVKHPIVKDTATLTSEGYTYVLNGLTGLSAPYNAQFQAYIVANGDSVTCMPEGERDHFVCLLPDGTDVAKAALVNGAARIGPGAPDSYRVQQLDALNNRRGYWGAASQDVVTAVLQASPPGEQYVMQAGDDGGDGITYVNGAPVALIAGEPAPVFLVFGDDLGWGYYDHEHHWRRAPDRYWHHLERFHAGGRGLPGYERGHFMPVGHEFARRPGFVERPGVREAGFRQEAHPGPGFHENAFRREGPGPAFAPHSAMAAGHVPGGFARPGGAPLGRPGGMPEMGRPGVAALGRPGMAQMGRPGFAQAGGFMRPSPGASFGGFHPGGAAGGFHPGGMAPMAHASAAAARPSAGGGGGGRHK